MAKAKAQETTKVEIPAVALETIQVPIRGLDGPLVCHNWSVKAISAMLAKQMGSKLAGKQPKNPDENYRECLYHATDGGYGFPAVAFKAAMVRASKGINGMDMIGTRQMLFVVPDCEENREFSVPLKTGDVTHRIQTPLVRLIGEPTMRMDMVRLNGKTADVRFRAQFVAWEAVLTIRHLTDRITSQEVVNLVNLAGNTVGVGEGRPEKSSDMTWGRWQIA